MGPVYLLGSSHRYSVWVGKDAFDGSVCLRPVKSRHRDEVLWFLSECWENRGRLARAQVDNARELVGWGKSARTLSRVTQPCLRFGVSPVFIPGGEPRTMMAEYSTSWGGSNVTDTAPPPFLATSCHVVA